MNINIWLITSPVKLQVAFAIEIKLKLFCDKLFLDRSVFFSFKLFKILFKIFELRLSLVHNEVKKKCQQTSVPVSVKMKN